MSSKSGRCGRFDSRALSTLKAALIGGVAGFVASALTVTSYLIFILDESPTIALIYSVPLAGTSLLPATLLGSAVSGITAFAASRSPHFASLCAVILASVGGAGWAFWMASGSPHVSSEHASIIGATVWAIAASVIMTIAKIAKF